MPAKSASFLLPCLANVLLVLSLLVFAAGFFPHKAFLPGLNPRGDHDDELAAAAPFDKLIFMVVDALRSDFVFEKDSHFNFTRSLIEQGAAVPFTGFASAPTVTMPRVKGITTGSPPSFLDLVLNVAESDTSSTLAAQDTWLAQIRAKPGGGKLVFYGDDTWLKLFPGFFERADGTSSFFVSDFTEVDNNVTRHIPEELARDDWDGMIMHFLGLDHIGHKAGPKSPNMPHKQREMDGIVQQMYQALETEEHLQSTLIVMLGDHGMNDAGNHGGSSAGETSTALVFMSPKFKKYFKGFEHPEPRDDFRYHKFVQQSDLAPTLAALLGLPIPLNNLGTIIPDFLPMWEEYKIRVELMLKNVWQILSVTQATFPAMSLEPMPRNQFGAACKGNDLSDIESLRCEHSRLTFSLEEFHAWNFGAEKILDSAFNVLQKAQSIMTGAATNYELDKMFMGIGLAALAIALSIASISSILASLGWANIIMSSTLLLHSIMMFASSFVEEEQQFWYWATSAWLFFEHLVSSQKSSSWFKPASSFIVFVLFRFARRWNQTGQKFAGEPDIATTFFRRFPLVLWILVALAYIFVAMRLTARASRYNRERLSLAFLAITSCVSSFAFKFCFTMADAPELLTGLIPTKLATMLAEVVGAESIRGLNLTNMASITFVSLAALLGWQIYAHRLHRSSGASSSFDALSGIHDVLTLFLITQSRAVNIPLFFLFNIQLELLLLCQHLDLLEKPSTSSGTIRTNISILFTTILLSQASFFNLGNSNSISSIDLSNAYNGISSFNVVAVGFLIFVSNWAGPIWWLSASNILLHSRTPMTSTAAIAAERNKSSKQAPGPTPTTPLSPSAPSPLQSFSIQTLVTSISTLAVMVSCFVLREHLFIWTVFSPKYLYQAAWILGYHLGIQGLFGWALRAAAAVEV